MNSLLCRILHLEDNATDTELIQATLEGEGVEAEVTRVEAEDDFIGALKHGRFDLILADYTLPSFDGLSALRIAQRYARDVPFVFVSGTLGEDIAIEALKRGATDYVLKTRMARLGPAVKRALREAREKVGRRCAEEALRDSEEQWKAAFEFNPVMYFMVDRAGTTLSVNNCGADQLGYERSELIGQPVSNICHEDDREFVQNNAENCFQNLGRTMRWEARKVRKDGTVIWARETANALLLKNKPVLLMVSEDITGRKRAEEAVRRSEKQLRDLVETMPAMAIIMRPDGTSEYASRRWIEFSGLSPEQTADSGWEVTLHSDDAGEHLTKWRESWSNGQPFENEARHRDANGNYRWLLVRVVPLGDEHGNILKWYGALTDIEDRKRAEGLLAGEKRILEMLAKGDSLSQILDSLCRLVEEQASGVLASILLVDGNRLRHGGAPSLPKAYTDAIDGGVIGPCAGSCGTAAYRGQQVIVEDIATDPLCADYRGAALLHSLRACWSTPIFSSQGKVIATFAMYYHESGSPSLRHQQIFEQITVLAGIAIERKRAEEALRASEQLARSHVEVMMRTVDVLATEAAPEKFIGETLRTIGHCLHACSVMLWLRGQKQDDSLSLRGAIEDDQQVLPDPGHPFVKDPQGWKTNRLIQEMLFTRAPVVCDDIEHDSRIGAEFRRYLADRACEKFLILPVLVLGEVRGFVGIQHVQRGAYRANEIELAKALAHHAMMAAQGLELVEQQRRAAVLEERTRMARDIHDTLAQGFTGVIVQLDAAVEALRDEEPEGAAKHIRRARELARESLGEARCSVRALRPEILQKASFCEALRSTIEKVTIGTPLHSEFKVEGEARELAPEVENNLLHIGQEALTNALKHARATEFEARLSFEAEAVRLELRDNGDGFVVDDANGAGFGLIGMRERAEWIGGALTITSELGTGTTIVAVSPYQQPKA
jgi:PAS domain S-box-containing protein